MMPPHYRRTTMVLGQVPLSFSFFFQVLIQSPFSRMQPFSDYELLKRRDGDILSTGPDINSSLKATKNRGRRTTEEGLEECPFVLAFMLLFMLKSKMVAYDYSNPHPSPCLWPHHLATIT